MPRFRAGNSKLLLPGEEGICHKIRRIPKPEDWADLLPFSERKDLITTPEHPQPQDTIILAELWGDEIVYFEIKALRG